jgi:hypothetical protein
MAKERAAPGDLASVHGEGSEPFVVSGPPLRRPRRRRARPDPRILRAEIAAVLIEAYQHGFSP